MYCYKLNNSYTVYCIYPNYIYNHKKTEKESKVSAPIKNISTSTKASIIQPKPFPNGTPVTHKYWGCGKIKSTDKNGYMVVTFGTMEKKFLYPMAFDKGYLQKLA